MTSDIVKQLQQLRDHHATEFERISKALAALTGGDTRHAAPTKGTATTTAKAAPGRAKRGAALVAVRKAIAASAASGDATATIPKAQLLKASGLGGGALASQAFGRALKALATNKEILLTKDGVVLQRLQVDAAAGGNGAAHA